MNAFEAAEKNGKSTELQGELEALYAQQNQRRTANITSVMATFLKVTVAVPTHRFFYLTTK